MTTQELFLNDLDYSTLKQSVEYSICKRIDNDIFSDFYHNVSYFVPVDMDKVSVMRFVTNLLIKDLK